MNIWQQCDRDNKKEMGWDGMGVTSLTRSIRMYGCICALSCCPHTRPLRLWLLLPFLFLSFAEKNIIGKDNSFFISNFCLNLNTKYMWFNPHTWLSIVHFMPTWSCLCFVILGGICSFYITIYTLQHF